MKHVVIVGAGGNIGSHLVTHIARMPQVGRVTLIDRDSYEEKNLFSQDITKSDVGKKKAIVQAHRLNRIGSEIQVEAIPDQVENIPIGRLRSDAILAGLDSLAARRYVNQIAWRLNIPWIDSGVEAGGLLTRINVYVPSLESSPCLECAWDREYEMQEQAYPCEGDSNHPPATHAPSSLGALAASLQALECGKLFLSDQSEQVAVGKQVLIDALHHRHFVTLLRRNPKCRFDHRTWEVEPYQCSLEQCRISELFRQIDTPGDPVSLGVEGKTFVKTLRCIGCGQTISSLKLHHRLKPSDLKCKRCGGTRVVGGFDQVDCLSEELLKQSRPKRTLKSAGFLEGDLFFLRSNGQEKYYEITSSER